MYFSRILIANRGEIAVRIMRACRELGIETVAVYSDADAGALHVRLADAAVRVGPAAARESYLNIEAIIAAAHASGAQAIHPGYGFLSENPALARACEAHGIVFIAPPAAAIELMGSKIAAKELAMRSHVPVVPGYNGADQDDHALLAEAQRIGFPILIKASAGGGGKGMRAVHSAEQFADALAAARREALAAFGDDSVLLERLIQRPRHVEIQVLADAHGTVVALGERECSIQRRHQKVVEECPSPALTPALREQMSAAALRLASAAHYANAGTVEFIVEQVETATGNQQRFYFLEMNTRLQVEHPVSELVAGVDLVQLQIMIAAGLPLPFGQEDVVMRGHAIEMRIYAEDPTTGLPATGTLALFAPPEAPGVRNDVGVATGDVVSVHYDPMLAKLIVAGSDRAAAVRRLQAALDAYTVLGVATNLPQLRAIAAQPAFVAGETFTDFLEVHPLSGFDRHTLSDGVLAAAALSDCNASAWRLHRANQPLRYNIGKRRHNVVASQESDNSYSFVIDGTSYHARCLARRPAEIVFALGAIGQPERLVRARIAPGEDGSLWVALRDADNLYGSPARLTRPAPLTVDRLGRSAAQASEGGLVAPMPGTIVKLLVAPGDSVSEGQHLLVLEAMKMEHTLVAPFAGTVRALPYAVGQLVPAGAQLAELTLCEP